MGNQLWRGGVCSWRLLPGHSSQIRGEYPDYVPPIPLPLQGESRALSSILYAHGETKRKELWEAKQIGKGHLSGGW
jgi:hypothetical protein